MAIYTCFRCMKNYEDHRDASLACPSCHARVSLRSGPPPLNVSSKRLLIIHQNRVYTEMPVPDRRLARRGSLQKTFDAYQQRGVPLPPLEGISTNLSRLRHEHSKGNKETIHDVSSMDVYPLILLELAQKLAAENIEFVLYGSGALWFEGFARPQKQVRIKDLDMCVSCPPQQRQDMFGRLKTIMSGMTAVTAIEMDDGEKVYFTNGGTVEFISPHENLQFSFNLQPPGEFNKTKSLMKKVKLSGAVSISVAGMDFITHRLFGEDALIATRLFRADKTRQVLMYAAMAVGYGKRPVGEIVEELLTWTIRLSPTVLVQKLKSLGRDSYSKTNTEFHAEVKTLTDRYETTLKTGQKGHDDFVQKMSRKRKDALELARRENANIGSQQLKAIGEKFRKDNKAATEDADMTKASWVLEAEETLKNDVLKFLIKYLGDVDNQLWSAAWLPFDQMVKVKQGQLRLSKALEEEIF